MLTRSILGALVAYATVASAHSAQLLARQYNETWSNSSITTTSTIVSTIYVTWLGDATATASSVATASAVETPSLVSDSNSASDSDSGSESDSGSSSVQSSATASAAVATSSSSGVPAPKVLVISMFTPEADIWLENLDFVHNVTFPGLSMLFPVVQCLEDYSVCQLTTGEGEINAAVTITSLLLSGSLNLTKTYFLVAGIAGINPYTGTLGTVSFAKYAVQGDLQYELDARQMPDNWTTGWIPDGVEQPGQYPSEWYGTEVFELNENLRDRAIALFNSSGSALNDSSDAQATRSLYDFAPANQPPQVIPCDVLTTNNYFYGNLLSESFGKYTNLVTNGSAVYCMTAQEDNATLEAMIRAAMKGIVDFSRIVIMRTASDIDRAPPKYADDPVYFFNEGDQGGFEPSIENIFIAGYPFVKDVVDNWDSLYESGDKYAPSNYIGDVFGSLGGTPDFGPSSL